MTISITTFDDLIEFLKRDDVTAEQGIDVACKALSVICPIAIEKPHLVKAVENFVERWGHIKGERPLFLTQMDLDVKVSELIPN